MKTNEKKWDEMPAYVQNASEWKLSRRSGKHYLKH